MKQRPDELSGRFESEAEQNLEDEIGDILYTLICFANSNNIDLDKAASLSLKKVMGRDKDRFGKKNQVYPVKSREAGRQSRI